MTGLSPGRARDDSALEDGPGPFGDSSFHLPTELLVQGFEALVPPRAPGVLSYMVARGANGVRQVLDRARLTPELGVPGDAWARRLPLAPEAQITLMRADVARLIANGQPLTLFGDNLLVDFDLSVTNLPVGRRFRVGSATLEVTAKPHNGCRKFRQRFGPAALRLTANPEYRQVRPRGIYARVVRAGEVNVGDSIELQASP